MYHLIFPFRRLIALDLDLKFVTDVADLADEFERMSNDHLVGIANDLAPHYWYDFRHFRRRYPGTPVGQVRPGLQVIKRGGNNTQLTKFSNGIEGNRVSTRAFCSWIWSG